MRSRKKKIPFAVAVCKNGYFNDGIYMITQGAVAYTLSQKSTKNPNLRVRNLADLLTMVS